MNSPDIHYCTTKSENKPICPTACSFCNPLVTWHTAERLRERVKHVYKYLSALQRWLELIPNFNYSISLSVKLNSWLTFQLSRFKQDRDIQCKLHWRMLVTLAYFVSLRKTIHDVSLSNRKANTKPFWIGGLTLICVCSPITHFKFTGTSLLFFFLST